MYDVNLCKLFDVWIIFMNEIVFKSMFVWMLYVLEFLFLYLCMKRCINLFFLNVCVLYNNYSRLRSRGNDIFIFLKNVRILKGYGIKRILYIYLNNNFII